MKAHCVRCKMEYEDEEDYYCSSCLAAKNELAKELDEKMKNRPPQPQRPTLDELPLIPGTTFIDSRRI